MRRHLFRFLMVLVAAILDMTLPAAEAADKSPPQDRQSNAWKPGAADRVLPGFLPAPAELPGIGRWQMLPLGVRSYIWTSHWSPDGEQIAFGDSAQIRICQSNDLKLLQVLVGHTGRVTSIDWNSQTGNIATASGDGTIRVWSSAGVPGPVLKGHKGSVRDVSWKSDGQQLASCGSDGTVRIWHVDGTQVRVIDGHFAPVNCVAWNPKSDLIAAGDDNRTIRLWKIDGTSDIPPMEGHRGPLRSLSWSPDGQQLASGSHGYDPDDDQEESVSTVRLWNVDGRSLQVLNGHTGPVNSVDWSPDGKQIASVGWSATVRIWSPAGDPIRTLPSGGFLAFNIAWSPDSKRFSTGGRGRNLMVFEAETGRTLANIGGKPNLVLATAWSPNGEEIATAGRDRLVRVWGANGVPRFALEGHRFQIHSVNWSPSGKELISASDDGSRRIWYDDGTPGPVITEGAGSRSAAFSSDGKWIASTASRGNAAQLLDADGNVEFEFPGHMHGLTCVSWKPDSTQFATSSFDSTVRIWNIDGTNGPLLEDLSAPTRAVAWSPDGQTIATGREDANVKLWDPDGTERRILRGHDDFVETLAYSPDGKWLASGSWDATVRLWDSAGKAHHIFNGHDAAVFGLAWSPDSQAVVSGSVDNTIRAWEPETGKARWVAIILDQDVSITFSAAGQLLHGETEKLQDEFIYLVEQPNKAMKVLQPAEFQELLLANNLSLSSSKSEAESKQGDTDQLAKKTKSKTEIDAQKKQSAEVSEERRKRNGKITNTMKQFGLAMHNHHDAHGGFPAQTTYDANNSKLLSWRVHLLPFLGQKGLYLKFHLNEPWDSKHNQKLIEKMPPLFSGGSDELQKAGKTIFLAPHGKGLAFEGRDSVHIRDFTDGTSNTILIVAADDKFAVPWTKPSDWKPNEKAPFAGLIEKGTESFSTLYCDGSVRRLRASMKPEQFRAILTRNGGELVN